jgi:hypothetical protein
MQASERATGKRHVVKLARWPGRGARWQAGKQATAQDIASHAGQSFGRNSVVAWTRLAMRFEESVRRACAAGRFDVAPQALSAGRLSEATGGLRSGVQGGVGGAQGQGDVAAAACDAPAEAGGPAGAPPRARRRLMEPLLQRLRFLGQLVAGGADREPGPQ